MKILKYVLLAIVLLIVAIGTAFYLYTRSIRPDYEGSLDLAGLQAPVEVYFDTYGIPHIYAESQEDAYTAFGYIHAQERLWQMELLRRIAPGRLSEVFGASVIETDKFFRTLGIQPHTEKAVQRLIAKDDFPTLKATQAYLKGVNAFIENGYTPIEYTLTGLEKTPFTITDAYNIVGYMAFSFAAAHKTDPLISALQGKLKAEYLNDLSIHVDPATTLIKNYPNSDAYLNITTQTQKIVDNLPLPAWIGSNSWVVSPAKSKTGKVLFANDPHIGFSQPSVWYEAHLHTPDWEVYGYFIGGQPFAHLVHNRDIAIGLTMFENDDIDFFKETTSPEDPNKYQVKDQWQSFESRQETIKVKGEEDITIEVKSSRHGPIINHVIKGLEKEEPIAMWWVYTALPTQMLEVGYGFNHAKNIAEAREAASKIHAPGLNVMYGDNVGNIAWWAAASLPIRPPHVNSKTILNGASGDDDPLGYLPFSQNPQAENPPWGYVYSANNQPDTIANTLYPGYYYPEDRAKRIIELLESQDKIDFDKMQSMILDHTSPVAKNIAKIMAAAIQYDTEIERLAHQYLNEWQGTNQTNEVAPTIYQSLIYNVLQNTMMDEMGAGHFKAIMDIPIMRRSIAKLITNGNSIWWDDINTDKKESRADIINKAFKETVQSLVNQLGEDPNYWNWGKVHTIEHGHPMGKVNALRPYFNVGPFEMGSSIETINNQGFLLDGNGVYEVTFGPSTRRVIDFSDIENSQSILPTGQSGNLYSPHYKDQASMYVNGEFRTMLMNEAAIKTLDNRLVLKPAN